MIEILNNPCEISKKNQLKSDIIDQIIDYNIT
jgi:hypothetical protein